MFPKSNSKINGEEEKRANRRKNIFLYLLLFFFFLIECALKAMQNQIIIFACNALCRQNLKNSINFSANIPIA